MILLPPADCQPGRPSLPSNIVEGREGRAWDSQRHFDSSRETLFDLQRAGHSWRASERAGGRNANRGMEIDLGGERTRPRLKIGWVAGRGEKLGWAGTFAGSFASIPNRVSKNRSQRYLLIWPIRFNYARMRECSTKCSVFLLQVPLRREFTGSTPNPTKTPSGRET